MGQRKTRNLIRMTAEEWREKKDRLTMQRRLWRDRSAAYKMNAIMKLSMPDLIFKAIKELQR